MILCDSPFGQLPGSCISQEEVRTVAASAGQTFLISRVWHFHVCLSDRVGGQTRLDEGEGVGRVASNPV